MACACTMQVASSTALYCPCPLPQWVPGNHCQVLYPRGGAGRGVLAAAADAGVTCVATAVNTTASQLRPAEYCTIQLPISSGRVLTRSPELPVRARRWRLGDYDLLRVHLKSSTRIVPPPPAGAGHRPPAISIRMSNRSIIGHFSSGAAAPASSCGSREPSPPWRWGAAGGGGCARPPGHLTCCGHRRGPSARGRAPAFGA